MTDLDHFLPADPQKVRRPLARRDGPSRNTESLRASLDRVVDDIGFPADAGVTAASLDLGINLKRARLAKGLTQVELAKRIGLSQTALSQIENGRGPGGPTWTTILRICEALDIEPSFLPADAQASATSAAVAAPNTKVRMFKVSKGAKAKVSEAGLGDAAAQVALRLLSREALTWVTSAVLKAGLASEKPSKNSKPSAGPRLLSLAPHAGTKIEAINGPLVVIAADWAATSVHTIVLRKGAGKSMIRDGVAFVSNAGAIEVGNISNESKLVFAVPATQLLQDAETVSS